MRGSGMSLDHLTSLAITGEIGAAYLYYISQELLIPSSSLVAAIEAPFLDQEISGPA